MKQPVYGVCFSGIMIPSLQQLALRVVPTHRIFRKNLGHLFGLHNRLVKDLSSHPITPIDDHFLSLVMDPQDTSFFWMMEFINRRIHRLPLNVAVLACWQEYYMGYKSLVAFGMRTHWDRVVIFVYSTKDKERITDNLFHQKKSYEWEDSDWEFISTLQLERLFFISSRYAR